MQLHEIKTSLLLSDPRNAPGFVYRPETIVNEDGERVVSSPETAEWMQQAQVYMLSSLVIQGM